MSDKIDRDLVVERLKYEIGKLSQMRHTDKKHHDSVLWKHVREMERRLLYDFRGGQEEEQGVRRG